MDVNVHEAKRYFSELLERVELGEEITIMRANVPVAKLVAADRRGDRRELGWARGEIQLRDDALPSDTEDAFKG